MKKREYGSKFFYLMSVFIDFFVCKSQMKTKFARSEKLNQKSSHPTLLFLQLVTQGHSNYIGAYKRLKVANSQ